MARYTGPRDKISRRFGVALFGPSKALERRSYPPGQHGLRGGRRKKSDYAVALGEKQKLRLPVRPAREAVPRLLRDGGAGVVV